MRAVPAMKRALGLVMVWMAVAAVLVAQPQLRNAGAFLVAEGTTNKAVEVNEQVAVRLALQNVGDEVASNLVATIQSGNGVTDPVPSSQNYGTLVPCGPSAVRDFAFKCTAAANSLLLVHLDLQDANRSLGTVSFRFRVGPQVSHAENSASFAINAVGAAATYPSVLSVSNAAGTLVKVSVTLSNLSHTFPDDMDILLVSPGGDRVLLMSDACGGSDLINLTLTFTDDAQASLPDSGVPGPLVRPTNYVTPDQFPIETPSGPYAGVLSAFNGKEANGDWKLYIMDDMADDGGLLDGGWSLTLTTLPVVDTAPTLTFLEGTTNNTIRFSVSGRPGYPYAIESGPTLLQSSPLEAFKMPLSGTQIFEYSFEPQNRFYQAVTDP